MENNKKEYQNQKKEQKTVSRVRAQMEMNVAEKAEIDFAKVGEGRRRWRWGVGWRTEGKEGFGHGAVVTRGW